MTCPDCTAAAQREYHGFAEGCLGCVARGIGRLKAYPHAGPHTRQYRELLRGAGVTHLDVRTARALDLLHRAPPGSSAELQAERAVCCTTG
jgi:hypothetical protein